MKILPMTIRRILRFFSSHFLLNIKKGRFDPVYYARRYPDLISIKYTSEMYRHFRIHGRKEGRFPNEIAEYEALYHAYLSPSETFDLNAYKILNPDLRAFFRTEREYILHYIRHGKAEGRPCTFSALDAGAQDHSQHWARRLSPSQFSAWASDWLERAPNSRREAVAMFESDGVERLAPLRFELGFDPTFYRQHYARNSRLDDIGLYRRWLDGGEDRNESPNEAHFLFPFIGEMQFPDGFNWHGYTLAAGLSRTADRASALAQFFDSERDCRRIRKFIAHGDYTTLESLVRYRLNRHGARQADALLFAWRDTEAEWPPSMWVLRGDIDSRLGRREDARNAMVQAVACGSRTFHPVDQVARLDLAMGAPQRATTWLRAQRDNWRGSAAFERLAALCTDRWFESVSAAGHALLSAADGAATDAKSATRFNKHMASELAAITEAIEALEPAPARFEPWERGHVVLLANEDLRQCTHYRIEQKEMQFKLAGIELRRHASPQVDSFIADLPGAFAAIFYRVAATPDVIRAILAARRMGIPTYYEIDDLLFDATCYPPPYESYQDRISKSDYNGLRFGVPLFRFALSLCDNAIASTPALLERMTPIVRNQRGLLIRNGLDDRSQAAIESARRPGAAGRDRVRIFYGSGTLAHNGDFVELVAPALMRLMAERSDVDLVLIGHVPLPDMFAPFDGRILCVPPTSDIAEYWALLATCDINIAVLRIDQAADCKSEIKWLEAAMLGIPSVVSGTATYRDVISPGKDGLIADGPRQWYQALCALADDPNLRRTVGAAARKKALAQYSLEAGSALWRQEFSRPPILLERRKERLRVLICNVFFAPQSIGGATRVVEDNVARIARLNPDIQLAVFCTDEGVSDVGRLRTSSFGDVPVFRLAVSTGTEPGIFNADNIAGFRRVLDQFRPDIIHFHCIQRLTASIVQTAQDMKIPYLVTLHDAWWLSPHQFLVDDDGFLRLPSSDALAEFAERPSATIAAIHRRQKLDPLLLGADRILTVSESFAEVYRSAGIDPVTVIANGVPDLPAANPRPPAGGALRLAHIGGRASHKGADLVEAALRRGNFPDFHLLMIDGRMPPGQHIGTKWGQTAVTLSAPVAQADIASLYAEMDVLLAPSRWPESFGLVAREALHFGVWVVASRLGAMGDDVTEGLNGFLIDTDTRQELDAVLARLHAEPERFRQGMAPPIGKLRTSAEQADELAALYREIGDRSPRRL